MLLELLLDEVLDLAQLLALLPQHGHHVVCSYVVQQGLPRPPHRPLCHGPEHGLQDARLPLRRLQPPLLPPGGGPAPLQGHEGQRLPLLRPQAATEAGGLRHGGRHQHEQREELVAVRLADELIQQLVVEVQVGGDAGEGEGEVGAALGQEGGEVQVEEGVEGRQEEEGAGGEQDRDETEEGGGGRGGGVVGGGGMSTISKCNLDKFKPTHISIQPEKVVVQPT